MIAAGIKVGGLAEGEEEEKKEKEKKKPDTRKRGGRSKVCSGWCGVCDSSFVVLTMPVTG